MPTVTGSSSSAKRRPVVVPETSNNVQSGSAAAQSSRPSASTSRVTEETSARDRGFRYSDTCEVYLMRYQDDMGTVFAKKPRSIMASVLNDGSDLANTLVATSMDG